MTLWNWENGESEPREEQYARVVAWIETVEGGDSVGAVVVSLEAIVQNGPASRSHGGEGSIKPRASTGTLPPPDPESPADEKILLALVPPDGALVTNLSLIRKLDTQGWDEAKYWRVRDRLLDTGALIRGRGRGGSVRRRVTELSEQPIAARGSRAIVSEGALYVPLLPSPYAPFRTYRTNISTSGRLRRRPPIGST